MDELNMLRAQMETMKHSLEESRIINRQLMLTIMKQKSSWLNSVVKTETIALPAILLLIYIECLWSGASIWLAIAATAGCILDLVCDYKTLRIPPAVFSELDMVALRKFLLKQKRQRKMQFAIALPLGIIWAIWFIFEFFFKISMKDAIPSSNFYWIVSGIIIIALALILIICTVLYRKAQNINDDILTNLED